ncbi:Glycerol-3-phosphateO-acyltransferase [Mycoplasmopsis meleagridis]|uniref:Glycerol-3-phosphate acyltransferase n=1 Tax=Mycoplasmopsis meleagridis ATCC 25294 TaxID=1264554 RepID=A0A0F5H2H5_9BACT|nr:glycerol-3-phosphate 1-O-acyltransferase PlsY [Mycoplasmopsis meleagridis]KKB27032.1 Acyl-phosphate:glycerol-3-phosphateO-acyltransferase PlsY [Mycoplasmopsis meleagridis ATCC 25294]KUH47273.1 acyl-phosphate glycerol 3-phosphate acyltransferase [Mycoplasmopsis meleagridis]OAD18380.1 Glycerol-3-phosphateO-acyltransferase [Mycoplasmopsis meleagridis]VEU77513.1 G3P acyltransferase [Mycoplasmopsis meleagridis]
MYNVGLSLLYNIIFFLVGYIFIGSLNTSIILSKWKRKDDVRNYHSKNAGATNSLRTYGKKFALIVFLIDFFKVILSVLIAALIINLAINKSNYKVFVSPQIIALGIIIGHIFPCWFKFKGGKGVACSAALILTINLVAFLIAALIFWSIALTKKIVSLASISVALATIPFIFIPWMTQGILGFWINNVAFNPYLTPLSKFWFISPLIYLIASLLVVIMHYENIKRIINGKEKQLKIKK